MQMEIGEMSSEFRIAEGAKNQPIYIKTARSLVLSHGLLIEVVLPRWDAMDGIPTFSSFTFTNL